MSTQYTFDNKENYLNSVLISSASRTTYSIKTVGETSIRLDHTSVTTSDGTTGVIYWGGKGESFEISGATDLVSEVRTIEEIPGIFYSRRWDIRGKVWRTTYDKEAKTWKVFVMQSDTQNDQPVIVFHEHKSKALKRGEPATITVEPSVSGDDFLTLLLILLWGSFNQNKIKGGNVSTCCAGCFVCLFGLYDNPFAN